VLGFLATGSTLAAIAELVGNEPLRILAGWLFIISAIIAWYAATALMMNSAFGRTVMGLGNKHEGPQVQRNVTNPPDTYWSPD
jgi:succinate-acetate transporter protein